MLEGGVSKLGVVSGVIDECVADSRLTGNLVMVRSDFRRCRHLVGLLGPESAKSVGYCKADFQIDTSIQDSDRDDLFRTSYGRGKLS